MKSFPQSAFVLFLAGQLLIAVGVSAGDGPGEEFIRTDPKRAGNDWWSLQPLERPVPPQTQGSGWALNPIDLFVLAELESRGLKPAPPAAPHTLLRRLYADLVGLPPSPAEVNRFRAAYEHDPRQAVDSVVEELLGSPQYGERWARHWLDVARFGESDGYEYDALRPNAWPYRDWVIQALNQDLPYDRFVRLQIAGDIIEPGNPDAITATSFLVCGAFDGLLPQGDKMRMIMRQDELEDLVGTVSQSFLGLTVHCARCHDHKFDPITQKEYYQLAATLAGVHRGDRAVPEGEVYAVTPKPAPVAHLLIRGSPFQPAEPVKPGGLAAIRSGSPAFGLAPDADEGIRRRKLAEWIARADNPLLSRVIMNRLWHYHFGQGLVKTPNDLGFSGGRPSHPELLDWLALEFRARHWSLKAMHRSMVTSAAFQQSSQFDPEAARIDGDNRFLWRFTPQRLEAEVLRDYILDCSGQLNPTMGGPGYRDFNMHKPKGSWVYDAIDPEGWEFNRRSIYRTWARGSRQPLLTAFDCPDPSATTPARTVTTTPLNALALLNDSFVLHMADHFAERLFQEAGPAPAQQVELGYEIVFCRPAEASEVSRALPFIERNGLPAFCRVLFNTTEFVYVE